MDARGREWRPGASREALALRARLLATLRDFMAARGVMEVETPVLSRSGNSEPRIESFMASPAGASAKASPWFLRTSPEYPMKRLLAAGVGDCYELGRVFRAGEAGRRHNPEFTMLEWYRTGIDHHALMDEVVELVQVALALVGRRCTARRSSYRALFQDALGIDPFTATDADLQALLAGHGIAAGELRRDDWLDLLLTHRLQPGWPADQLLLVEGFPASQCALARVVERDGARVAERFEAFLGPLELANGYHELADADEQRARFERDNRERGMLGLPLIPLDLALLDALAQGLPDCAGVALGVDRLLSAMLGGAPMPALLAFDSTRA